MQKGKKNIKMRKGIVKSFAEPRRNDAYTKVGESMFDTLK